jgi:hypothetical protein
MRIMRKIKIGELKRGRKGRQWKRVKRIFLSLIIIVVFYYIGSGLYYSRYQPERSDHYLWGEYHVHSNLSDGFYSPEKISESAQNTKISFILLTDHGNPNIESSLIKKAYNGVYFIGGSEAKLPEGHLNFFDASSIPSFKLPPYPPDAIADVREWGGFTVLNYPEDPKYRWNYWDNDFNPDGIEIINISTNFRKLAIGGIIKTLLYSPFSRYYFLKVITRPEISLKKWDELLNRGRVYGFYAVNAHGGLHIWKNIKLKIPSYELIFSLLALGIDKKYQDYPESAIRCGDFFSVIRGAGEPQKFEFFAQQGDRIFNPGSRISGDADIHVQIKTKKMKCKIIVKRNGVSIKEVIGSKLVLRAVKNGIFRTEIYLLNHPVLRADVPWILSNPIFKDITFFETKQKNEPENTETITLDLSDFHVERDPQSSAIYTLDPEGAIFSYSLSKATTDNINRWCALALRKKMDLSPYSGVYFIGKSGHYIRYWIEIRNQDKWYYASFKLYSL